MKSLSRRVLFAGLLMTALACADDTGPSLDGPDFIELTINGKPWAVSFEQSVAEQGHLSFTGLHQAPDSGLTYQFSVSLHPFHGTGTYPVGENGAGVRLRAINSSSDYYEHASYGPQSTPGVVVSDFRVSDTTIVGHLDLTLTNGGIDPNPLRVVGTFRVRTKLD